MPGSPSSGGPGRIRTYDQTVMHPTAAFAASNEFVGWTIPSPHEGACRLVSTPSLSGWTGQGLARDYPIKPDLGFPEFGRIHQGIAPQAAHFEPSALPLSYGPVAAPKIIPKEGGVMIFRCQAFLCQTHIISGRGFFQLYTLSG
jgi:hypothetical protein